MFRAISLFVVLMAFWFLLSGQFTNVRLVVSGVVCCLAVTLLAVRQNIVDEEGHPIHLALRSILYIPWLFWQIILSNLDVAYRVWHPGRPIAPRMVRVPYRTKSDLATVIYANSITLTPGTVTVRVDPEKKEFLVHALTEKAEKGVLDGSMDARVRKLEGGE